MIKKPKLIILFLIVFFVNYFIDTRLKSIFGWWCKKICRVRRVVYKSTRIEKTVERLKCIKQFFMNIIKSTIGHDQYVIAGYGIACQIIDN